MAKGGGNKLTQGLRGKIITHPAFNELKQSQRDPTPSSKVGQIKIISKVELWVGRWTEIGWLFRNPKLAEASRAETLLNHLGRVHSEDIHIDNSHSETAETLTIVSVTVKGFWMLSSLRLSFLPSLVENISEPFKDVQQVPFPNSIHHILGRWYYFLFNFDKRTEPCW